MPRKPAAPRPRLRLVTEAPRTRKLPLVLLISALVTGVCFGMFAGQEPAGTPLPSYELADPSAVAASERLVLPQILPAKRERLMHQVRRGDTWASIAALLGFSALDALELDKAMRATAKAEPEIGGNLQIGQQLELERSLQGTLTQVRTSPAAGVTLELIRQEGGAFSANVHRLERRAKERVLLGVISASTPSFAQAATEAGATYDIVDDLVDLFSDRINFRQDFRVGDSFSAIFSENVLEDGTIVGVGPVLAAMLSVQGETYAAVRHLGSDQEPRYFNELGELLGNTFLRYPLRFTRISSQFSRARFHPVLKRYRPHNGVDFAAPVGTPVRSVAEGRVIFSGWKGPNGKMVKIRHSDRYSTAYLHLSRISSDVRNGARVRRGQVIGAVGTTGRSTGPHLHYSFYDRGRYVDPMKIKLPTIDNLDKKARIDPAYLKRVLITLQHYQNIAVRPANIQEASAKELETRG